MSRKYGNFNHNYPLVIKYLKNNRIIYHEFSDGQQIRILGTTRIVDLWPSRMVFHIIADEDATPSGMCGYPRLDFTFNEEQLNKLLDGEKV